MTPSDLKVLYVDRRTAHSALKRRMWRMLPPPALSASAALLGFSRDKAEQAVVLDSEDDLVIISDFAIYDYRLRREATTASERLSQRPPADLTAAERALLPALAGAHITLLRVVEPVPELGAQVDDLLAGARRALVDRVLGQSCAPGDYLVTRLLLLPEFAMTSAAALPVSATVGRELEQALHADFPSGIAESAQALSASERSKLSAWLVRTARSL